MSGVSWLGLDVRASLPSRSTVTNTQPEPNWRSPVVLKSAWNFWNPPRSRSMALLSSPEGSPPEPPMICQNMVWLACPPPLLRMVARIDSGAWPSFASISWRGILAASAFWPSAALRLFT